MQAKRGGGGERRVRSRAAIKPLEAAIRGSEKAAAGKWQRMTAVRGRESMNCNPMASGLSTAKDKCLVATGQGVEYGGG